MFKLVVSVLFVNIFALLKHNHSIHVTVPGKLKRGAYMQLTHYKAVNMMDNRSNVSIVPVSKSPLT